MIEYTECDWYDTEPGQGKIVPYDIEEGVILEVYCRYADDLLCRSSKRKRNRCQVVDSKIKPLLHVIKD